MQRSPASPLTWGLHGVVWSACRGWPEGDSFVRGVRAAGVVELRHPDAACVVHADQPPAVVEDRATGAARTRCVIGSADAFTSVHVSCTRTAGASSPCARAASATSSSSSYCRDYRRTRSTWPTSLGSAGRYRSAEYSAASSFRAGQSKVDAAARNCRPNSAGSCEHRPYSCSDVCRRRPEMARQWWGRRGSSKEHHGSAGGRHPGSPHPDRRH